MHVENPCPNEIEVVDPQASTNIAEGLLTQNDEVWSAEVRDLASRTLQEANLKKIVFWEDASKEVQLSYLMAAKLALDV